MLRMLDLTHTILPLHDSFIVRREGELDLLKIMKEAFKEVVGVEGKIDRSETVFDSTANDDWKDVIESLFTHSEYYRREYE